jgi:hypothetical protein
MEEHGRRRGATNDGLTQRSVQLCPLVDESRLGTRCVRRARRSESNTGRVRVNDFYQTNEFLPYQVGRLPTALAERLVPAPTLVEVSSVRRSIRRSARRLVASIPRTQLAIEPWLARLLDERHRVTLEVVPSGEATLTCDCDLRFELAAGPVTDLPPHLEAYVLRVEPESAGHPITVVANSALGLFRGATTFANWIESDEAGVVASCGRVVDAPLVDLRILGGWALCRGERLREAVDVAALGKANRALYNAWGWVPGDRLTDEDAHFVQYARERGVELIFELRRMSFGKDWPLADRREEVFDVFRAAVERGFRSFGFLFDDVPWESADSECDFLVELWSVLSTALGAEPELYACPQYYWNPGQMSISWTGPAEREERELQRRYLETWGRRLPVGIRVYIANYWSDTPSDYAKRLRDEYSDLLGRKPIFFDNQLINDYRLGVVLPFALRGRPADFADHYEGYLINAPRPLDAQMTSILSSLAYAWNPRGYSSGSSGSCSGSSGQAHGAAIALEYGSQAAAMQQVFEGLGALANSWADQQWTATNHYRTLWQLEKRERLSRDRIGAWASKLDDLEEELSSVLSELDRFAPTRVRRGVSSILGSVRRLRTDLEVFDHYVTARETGHLAAFSDLARRARRVALRSVIEILPPLPGLELLVEAEDGTLARRTSERFGASSWIEYFYANTRREIDRLIASMSSELAAAWPEFAPRL